jgi:hypothetical protein
MLLQTQALSQRGLVSFWAFHLSLLYALIYPIVLDPAQAVC